MRLLPGARQAQPLAEQPQHSRAFDGRSRVSDLRRRGRPDRWRRWIAAKLEEKGAVWEDTFMILLLLHFKTQSSPSPSPCLPAPASASALPSTTAPAPHRPPGTVHGGPARWAGISQRSRISAAADARMLALSYQTIARVGSFAFPATLRIAAWMGHPEDHQPKLSS